MHDAYCHHSKYLLKKAKELEEITSSIVNPQITPTWEKWVQKLYHTEGQEIDFNRDIDLNSSRTFDTSTGDISHETPKQTTENQNQTKRFRKHLQDLQNSVRIKRR